MNKAINSYETLMGENSKTASDKQMRWAEFSLDITRKQAELVTYICNIACSVAKERRSLAMALVYAWAKAGGAEIKTEDYNDAKQESARIETESMNTIFSNISIF